MFDHEGPTVANTMRDLTVGVFGYLGTTFKLDIYKRIKYTEKNTDRNQAE